MRRSERVSKWMTRDVRTVQVGQRLSEVSELMRSEAFHHVPVVDGARLVGILSATDLLRVSYEYGVDDRHNNAVLDDTVTIRELMTEPLTVRHDATVRDALELLASGKFHAVPVVGDAGEVVGILTTTDVVRNVLDLVT